MQTQEVEMVFFFVFCFFVFAIFGRKQPMRRELTNSILKAKNEIKEIGGFTKCLHCKKVCLAIEHISCHHFVNMFKN